MYHTLPFGFVDQIRFFSDRATGYRFLVSMQQVRFLQTIGNYHIAACPVHIVGHKTPSWLQIGQQRGLPADAVEVVDHQINAGFLGDGQQVEDAVGGAAGHQNRRDRVLKRLPRHDIPGAHVIPHQVHHQLTAAIRHIRFLWIVGGDARSTHGRDAQHLERDGHRVRGKLAPAGPGARTGAVFHQTEILF